MLEFSINRVTTYYYYHFLFFLKFLCQLQVMPCLVCRFSVAEVHRMPLAATQQCFKSFALKLHQCGQKTQTESINHWNFFRLIDTKNLFASNPSCRSFYCHPAPDKEKVVVLSESLGSSTTYNWLVTISPIMAEKVLINMIPCPVHVEVST